MDVHHFIPEEDFFEHKLDPDCLCNPAVDARAVSGLGHWVGYHHRQVYGYDWEDLNDNPEL